MSNANLNKARELLIQKYIDALKQEKIPWERGWNRDLPRNAISKTEYRGVNSLLLSFIAEEKGYSGNRWCTFNQIADKDEKYHPNQKWHLKKGSESVPIEYWFVYNIKERKKYTFSEYQKVILADPEREKEFRLSSRVYLVFNEDCIEGIPKDIQKEKPQIDRLEVIDKVITNMGVSYEEKGSKAYYSSLNDIVVIPPMKTFKNEYYYCSTQLHELCHATGHSSRLNRNLGNSFGSEEYAKEELRAEISSSFLMQELDLEYDESHMNNHAAYIQSWISVLEKNPNELFRAIQDANNIVEYVEELGEINKEKATVPTVKVGDQIKAFFIDYDKAKEFANSVKGTLHDVDFLGGYEVYYMPEKNTIENDDFEMEM